MNDVHPLYTPIDLTMNSDTVLQAQFFFALPINAARKKRMVKDNPHGTTSLHMLGITRVILRSYNVDQLVKKTRVYAQPADSRY